MGQNFKQRTELADQYDFRKEKLSIVFERIEKVNLLKKQKGSYLDEYLSHGLIVVGSRK